MTANDMEMIIYKILAYLYECMKNGVSVSMDEMCSRCKLFKIPEKYWCQIMQELISAEYIKGFYELQTKDGVLIQCTDDARITIKGRDYLRENNGMREAKAIAGDAFQIVLESVIKAAINSGRLL